jgi:hypothetical protein
MEQDVVWWAGELEFATTICGLCHDCGDTVILTAIEVKRLSRAGPLWSICGYVATKVWRDCDAITRRVPPTNHVVPLPPTTGRPFIN